MEKTTDLIQLIPGNPGTSFVVAILFVLQEKYGLTVKNETQFSLYTSGIVKSPQIFFGGIASEISKFFGKKVSFFTDSEYFFELVRANVDSRDVDVHSSKLGFNEIMSLLKDCQYLVVSVDIFQFRGYHDYHFVAVSRAENGFQIFEPKSGKISFIEKVVFSDLISSIPKGLKDVMMIFAI